MWKNGTVWEDEGQNPLCAHGGSILEHEGRFYWYGEYKQKDNLPGSTRVLFDGISCYSTGDFESFRFEGIVLPPDSREDSPLHESRICERPRVLYNEKTGKFVMWVHLDTPDYQYAHGGVAVADSPCGPFQFLGAVCVNRKDTRDFTLYQEDGKAWLIHSSDWNKTLYISELDETFTRTTGRYYKAFPDQEREAPAVLKWNGRYYMVTSGCTGWEANSMLYGQSDFLESGWKLVDNPCVGEGARKTFRGQGTCLFRYSGRSYLLLDHWKPYDLKNSGYSILPVLFGEDGMTIMWQDYFLPEKGGEENAATSRKTGNVQCTGCSGRQETGV